MNIADFASYTLWYEPDEYYEDLLADFRQWKLKKCQKINNIIVHIETIYNNYYYVGT